MTTVAVAWAGAATSIWLARASRRFAVVDRVRPLARDRGRLPAWLSARLVPALDAAALDVAPEHAVQMWALATTCALGLGLALDPAVGVSAAAAVAAGGPIALRAARQRSTRLAARTVPDAVERVAAELRAGGTVATAVSGLAGGDGPLASDFARVEARVRLGAALPDALARWAQERRAAGVPAVAGALALAAGVGGRCADALEGLASSTRERTGIAAEVRAMSAQARLSAVIIGVGPFAYLAVSAAVDPRTVRALVSTPGGRVCAIVGLALETVGALWMRRILRAGDGA